MKLAILFWFYKDPALCENRLRLLRAHNPQIPIFGLFGGYPADAPAFRSRLAPFLNDFHTFTGPQDPQWKWFNGDLMIARWHAERRHQLTWDTLVIVQWDMLVIGNVHDLFPNLQSDQILLSGYRPLREVAKWWLWLKPGELQTRHEQFMQHIRARYAYSAEPHCCQFIVVCFPRNFLDAYAQVESPEFGFIEYRIPAYAQLFGIDVCTAHPYNPAWLHEPGPRPTSRAHLLNAESHDIPLRKVLANLLLPSGQRIFHPFSRIYPQSRRHWPALLTADLTRTARRAIHRLHIRFGFKTPENFPGGTTEALGT